MIAFHETSHPSPSNPAGSFHPGGQTDIVTDGWIARLPQGLRPYALLARLDRPIGVWLLFLPGLWGILLPHPGFGQGLWLITLFALGSVVMRAAGCVVNDLWDRDIDRQVTRTAGRPLASGQLRPRQALAFLALLLACGLVVLLQLNATCQIMGVFSLLPVTLYPLAKRVTSWPQAVLGLTFGFGAPMGAVAVTGHVNASILALYGAAILWDLGFDTIYAHQDREDDALVGIGSTALLFGEQTRLFVAGCYLGVLLLLIAAGLGAGMTAARYLPALIPAAALLGWQVWRVDIHDPALCLRLFRLNRETGLAVAFALLVGAAA